MVPALAPPAAFPAVPNLVGIFSLVLAHLPMAGARWDGPAAAAATAAVALSTAGQAWTMVARWPATRLVVPPCWALERDDAPAGPGGPEAFEQRGRVHAERLDEGGRAFGVVRSLRLDSSG